MEKTKCIYRRMTWRFISSLLLSLCFVQGASAAQYYWSTSYVLGTQFPNPKAACDAIAAKKKQESPYVTKGVPVPLSETYVRCEVYIAVPPNPEGQAYDYGISRNGNECISPSVWDSSVMGCVTPEPEPDDPCAEKAGQQITFSTTADNIVWEACISSCSVAVTSLGATSQPKSFGPVYAHYTGTFTGEQCDTDTPTAQETDGIPDATESESEKECEATQTVEDAEGRVHTINSCTTTDSTRDNQKCVAAGGSVGEIDGVKACIAAGKGPSTTEKTTKEDKEKTTEPDGSKTQSDTTTTTTTKCKGGVCTSTTTTTNNTSKTNSDGTDGGSSSSCKGSNCGSGGQAVGDDGDEESDGDEEAEGECDPETDPNRCGQSSVSGEECDATVLCSGDAIQCAIMRQQKIQQCADQEFRELTPEKETQVRNALETEFSGESFQPFEADSESTFDLTSMISTTSHFSSSCPVFPDFSFTAIGGSTVNVNLNDLSAQLCDFFRWMGFLVVAFAMRRGVEIVAAGFN